MIFDPPTTSPAFPGSPEAARQAHLEGIVVVGFTVNATGEVTDAVVLQRVGGGCEEATLAAVRAVRFAAARRP